MDEEKTKKVKSKFIKQYFIFVIMAAIITIVSIIITIKYLENEETIEKIEKEVEITGENSKEEAEDSKYGIKSYTETYNENSIKTKTIYDIDGAISEKRNYETKAKKVIEYIEIEGLKDKEIQNKVNKKLKDIAYKATSKNNEATFVDNNQYVTANFSNILSVNNYCYSRINDEEYLNENTGININLCTGEEIKLEDVFVSSAPLNLYLEQGLYKRLAWNTLWDASTEEEYVDFIDMDKQDTKEYEDKAIILLNNYKKNKENITFSIFPNEVVIYNLINEKRHISESQIDIDFVENYKEIAIYKRYLTEQSIFEDDSIGDKGNIIFTGNDIFSESLEKIAYGKSDTNLFSEAVQMYLNDEKELNDEVRNFIKKNFLNKETELKEKLSNDNAAFLQVQYDVNWIKELDCYSIASYGSYSICSQEYFKEDAFKDYIHVKLMERVEAGLNMFSENMKDDYINLQINDYENENYYLNEYGEIIGYTFEEAKQKLKGRD